MLSVLVMAFLSMGFPAYAADASPEAKANIPFIIEKADGTPAVENDDYTVNGIVIDFNKSGQYKIIGDGQEVTDKASFHVGNDFEGEITLKDVKVNLNGIRSAFKVESDAKLTLLEVVKSFTISKADSKIGITTETRDKGYDEKPVAEPVVEKAGSTNAVSFTWYQKKGDTWKRLVELPKTQAVIRWKRW